MPRWDINFDYRIDMDNEILRYMVQVEAHRQITSRIPVPPRLMIGLNRLVIVREVKGTTGLEGNPLTEAEVERVIREAGTSRDASKAKIDYAELEVQNAYLVQKYVRRLVSGTTEPPIVTEDLIKHLHSLSTQGIPSETNVPGHYRTGQVVVGSYEPPDPHDVPRLMQRFIEVVNSRRLIEGFGPVIRALVAHFYLISIHPFGDGNGRTSRAVEALLLYHSRFNARGFYSLANFFYRHRDEYVQHLQDARFVHDADLTSFVKFALRGLVEEITSVQDHILSFVRETMFLSYVEEKTAKGFLNVRCVAILTFLVQYKERLTVQQLRDRRHPIIKGLYESIRTDKTVMRDIEMLKRQRLIVIDDVGRITPNISIMEQYTDSGDELTTE